MMSSLILLALRLLSLVVFHFAPPRPPCIVHAPVWCLLRRPPTLLLLCVPGAPFWRDKEEEVQYSSCTGG